MNRLTSLLSAIVLIFSIALFNSCQKDKSIAVLTTSNISDITLTTAKSGGTVSNDGGAAVTARGVCWSKSEKPTIKDNITTNGTGTGSFESELTGLLPGTTYYVRAYATNSEGTAYGNQESFATSIAPPTLSTVEVADITLTTAMGGGRIISSGGDSITAKGICWSTTAEPTVDNSKTTDGTGWGSFVSHMTDLKAGTTYYVRAYATNNAGTGYGNQVFFTTSPIVVPTLTTTAITAITGSTASSGGNISNDGGGTITARGVCWSTSNNPTISNFITSNGTGTGSFQSNLTGLSAGTTYYVRSYATNSAGTGYGNTLTFQTTPVTPAVLTTVAVTNITATTAISGGNISSDGGNAVTIRGICWNTTGNPTTADSKTSNGTGSGAFSSDLSGLTPGTTYYVRAYATNSTGTAYGNQLTFTTTIIAPVLSTVQITEITFNSAKSGGTITTSGGSPITAKGVCWSTLEDPTTAANKTDNGVGSGNFTSNLINLLPATTYYVRAYATNSIGTSYGNQLSFTTAPAVPTLTTVAPTDITVSGAKTGGNISNDGGAAVTLRGVCWSLTQNPTIENSKTENGAGTGAFVSDIAGLSPGETYYIRAYATNSAGTGYGNQITINTLVSLPSLTTTAATGITLTTAISGGNISNDGGGTITVRGVCWSTSQNPTTTLITKTENGTGPGSFTSNITGLTPGTTYYVRAYARNSAGTAYGNQTSFTTTPVGGATLSTTVISSLTPTTAVSGGNITDNGGGAITARGICWNTSPNPTTANSITTNGTGNGSFTSNITGLTNGTTYYVRAYATNISGTSYGNELTFITPVADIEGNVYKTVKIGAQVWMAENLKVTKLNDNTNIPNVAPSSEWIVLSTPAYCLYNNAAANKNIYGALYNWFAVNTHQLCPAGWHEPTDNEYNTLEVSLGLPPADVDKWGWRGVDGGQRLKSTTGWLNAGNGTNTSGFTALAGGYRQWVAGDFPGLGILTYFWTATDDASNGNPTVGWYRRVDGDNNAIYKATTEKIGGKYVRCVKD